MFFVLYFRHRRKMRNLKPLWKNVLEPAMLFVFSVLFICAVTHGIRHRYPQDFVRYGGFTALAIGSIMTFGGILTLIFEGPIKMVDIWKAIAGIVFGSLLMGVVYYAAAASLWDFYKWVSDPGANRWVAPVGAVLVFTIGGALFYFRLRLRTCYGVTEILAGVAVGIQKASNHTATRNEIVFGLLTASIYLIVRGLDNVHQGLVKEPFDPLASAARKWLEDKSL